MALVQYVIDSPDLAMRAQVWRSFSIRSYTTQLQTGGASMNGRTTPPTSKLPTVAMRDGGRREAAE